MATIDFLPFATGSGANVMSQAEWAALTQRLSGFQSGVAQSAQLNKAWRQSSIMAAVIAQFISDITGQDVIDDGTTASILANLKSAVSAQATAVVGTARNARMFGTAPSPTATFMADEIVVSTALGGRVYRLPNFSRSVNLATTGAGGMDTGSPPSSGFVALYAIYNPTSGSTALLATNATNAIQPEVYGGANMPSGYTASALVSVLPSASGQFGRFTQIDRDITVLNAGVITSSAATSGITAFNTSSFPKNAKKAKFYSSFTATDATVNASIYADSHGTDQTTLGLSVTGSSGISGMAEVLISQPQTVYYQVTISGSSFAWALNLERYTI